MGLRALNLPLTTLVLLAIGLPIVGQPSEPTSTLRIESLSRAPIHVRMILKMAGARRTQRLVSDSVLALPADVHIADSIHTVHLIVTGFGSVRAELHDDATPSGSPIMAEGRDLTFSRDSDGHFHRSWTVQPLVP
jgi:hypothetical protein